MKQYDDEISNLTIKERIDIRGAKPMPMRTSWGMGERRDPPPPRPEKWVFYIDTEDGMTVGKAKSIEEGYRTLEAIRKESGRRLVLRPYLVCEETLQTEERIRKERRQYASTW